MPHPIRMRVARLPAGGLSLAVGHADVRAVEGVVDPEVAERVASAIGAALGEVPPVLVPGRDAARTAGEERAGRALGELVQARPELVRTLAWSLGEAQGRHATAVVVVDAEDPVVRSLPWELLAVDGPPLEAVGEAVVVRLVSGRPRPRPAPGALRVATWVPDPADPICRDLAARLGATLDALGIAHDALGEGPDASVLHVVCHGRRVLDQVGLGERSAGTAAHVLLPALRAADLVVLDVCEAGDTNAAELDTVAGRLVAAGAPACVAPLQRAGVDAAAALSRGLYGALAEGEALADAVAAARRAVRALCLPHPDSRWCNFALYVGDLATAAGPGRVAAGWAPEGWPALAADAAALLKGAREHAERSGAGFVGLEHVAQALADVRAAGPLTTAVRHALSGHRAELDRVRALRITSDPRPDWRGTPRLRDLGAAVPAGADLEGLWPVLWPALATVAGIAEHALPAGSVSATLDWESVPTVGEALPAGGLEVVGGPEDGRVLRPAPGEVVGRKHLETPGLYEGTALVDPYLSRRALTWRADGDVELVRSTERRRGGSREDIGPGPVEVKVDDVLVIGPATRVRGIS